MWVEFGESVVVEIRPVSTVVCEGFLNARFSVWDGNTGLENKLLIVSVELVRVEWSESVEAGGEEVSNRERNAGGRV